MYLLWLINKMKQRFLQVLPYYKLQRNDRNRLRMGEFVKECMPNGTEILCPEKQQLFKTVSLCKHNT